MSLPLVPHARHLSVLAKSVLVLLVFALASCESPKNRFDYDPDGTPKKKPKYPKLAKPQKCATLHQHGGNVVVAALEVALGTFAFITPAAASTSMEEDLPLFRSSDAVLMAGDSGGGGEMIPWGSLPCP